MRWSVVLCLFVIAATAMPVASQEKDDWTVMVWMNADNNLEKFILNDWKELAAVGSTANVNVVVQLDLQGPGNTRRFLVTRQNPPVLQDADVIGESNMVDGNELKKFICWARTNFPAKKYALFISSHGDGWREIVVPPKANALVAAATAVEEPVRPPALSEEPTPEVIRLPPGVFGSPNRAITSDDNNRSSDVLYNREIADSLAEVVGGEPLELIVFDACLMGMIEVAYGLRNVARHFVASEELVDDDGMDYTRILQELTSRPAQDGETLARRLVKFYEEIHAPGERDDPKRTLGAFRLEGMDDLAAAITRLSNTLIDNIATQKRVIRYVRERLPVYAPNDATCGGGSCFHHVDLKRFVDLLEQESDDASVRAAAADVRRQFEAVRIDSYAGPQRDCDFGSKGLAVYFPATREQFTGDRLDDLAYRKANRLFPVEFVERNGWADFLHVYFLKAREVVQP